MSIPQFGIDPEFVDWSGLILFRRIKWQRSQLAHHKSLHYSEISPRSKMKLSTLFIANAIFALFGALSLLLMPEKIMASYGATLNESGKFLAQILGTTVLAMAAISYQARNLKDKNALKVILIGFLIAHVGSGIFALMAVSSGVLNSMGWVDVLAHGLLAIGFGYFLANKKFE